MCIGSQKAAYGTKEYDCQDADDYTYDNGYNQVLGEDEIGPGLFFSPRDFAIRVLPPTARVIPRLNRTLKKGCDRLTAAIASAPTK